jgi:uncharacterized protein (DUF2141 family)
MTTVPLLTTPPPATTLVTTLATTWASALAITLAGALVITLAVTLALPAAAQSNATPPAAAQSGCATVEVYNVRPGQGFLMVAAFADGASFRSRPTVALRLPAAAATMRFPLCGLVGDVVALALFQDLDGDGKMGANLVGMPTEPWGSSGSPGAFGPSWDSAKVALDGSPIVVRLSQ